MWIFSLGRTLMKTLPRATTLTSIKSMQSVQNQCAIVLQATIYKMCNFNVDERASLMFLLNVSSKKKSIFRNIKNFPHVFACLWGTAVTELTCEWGYSYRFMSTPAIINLCSLCVFVLFPKKRFNLKIYCQLERFPIFYSILLFSVSYTLQQHAWIRCAYCVK